MMFSDDDMNNNWKRIPAIESVSAECCKGGYGGILESGQSASAKKKKIITDFNYPCQVPIICQVDGCKMDLSSSKYYHQRHRVCVEHSKTIKAILHGVEQRFCQQCSRFHLLAEFDDDKRSCRKRLACHNKRRRKSRFHTHWDASFLLDMASQGASPFLIPEILSGNLNFCQEQENKTTSNNCPAEMLSSVQELAGGENSGAGGAFSLLSSTQSCRAEHRPGIEKSSNCMNYSRKCLKASPKRSGATKTIDLQQLSTHLRRVEQQRSSEQVKNQAETIMSSNNVLCCFTSM
nr:squamosa promoter-binding-like protein 6 [Ipomoea batatas]